MSRAETQSYGTWLHRTEVVPADGDGFWWIRRTGDRAESAFSPHPFVAGSFSEAEISALKWGVGGEHERWYHSLGNESLASKLVSSLGPEDHLIDALSASGQALRALHDASSSADAMATRLPPRPRPLIRLLRWLDGRATTPLGGRFRQNAAVTIGESTLNRLRERVAAVGDPSQLRIVHGAPGLGSIILSPSGSVEILIGEDVAIANPEYDVNWLIGELTELSWLSPHSEKWSPAINAVLSGYGAGTDVLDSLLIAARILLHAHDYVSYVQWDENAQEQYLKFVAHLASSEDGK